MKKVLFIFWGVVALLLVSGCRNNAIYDYNIKEEFSKDASSFEEAVTNLKNSDVGENGIKIMRDKHEMQSNGIPESIVEKYSIKRVSIKRIAGEEDYLVRFVTTEKGDLIIGIYYSPNGEIDEKQENTIYEEEKQEYKTTGPDYTVRTKKIGENWFYFVRQWTHATPF